MTDKEKAFIADVRSRAQAEGLPVMRDKTSEALLALVREKKPTHVLEIGTCVGVSTLTVLTGSDASVVTMEKNPLLAERARDNFRACGVENRVKVLEGDCNETISYLQGNAYDVVVLDGPKSTLPEQYESALPLLKRGGAMFIDDVAYHGMIAGEGAKHKQRTIIVHMRAFLEKLKGDDRVTATFYDEEDGYAVVEKK